MRLFIGLPLPASVRWDLTDAARGLGLDHTPWRLAAPETLHLTLAFLGETHPGQADAIRAAVNTAARMLPGPVTLETGPFDGFPTPACARVAVAGLVPGPGADAVRALAAALREALGRAGVAYDARPFQAHITLARTVGGRSADIGPDRVRRASCVFEMDAVTLWESRLGGTHAVHMPLHTERFGPATG